jgi:hypothetical protein
MSSPVKEWLRSLVCGTGDDDLNGWKTAEELIGELDLDEMDRKLLRTRWLHEAKRYEKLWARQRRWYYRLRVLMIIGAATVPVLAGLSVSTLATALVGLGVAILTGLDALFNLDSRWQQGRLAATEIGFEGWQFLELSAKEYEGKDHRDAFRIFLGRLEELNERLATRRLDLFRAQERKSPTPGAT